MIPLQDLLIFAAEPLLVVRAPAAFHLSPAPRLMPEQKRMA
ncbi:MULTISPECIES: hypothetical protein [unclassified Pseudomonas]|jgi:hypothetical protein|nr:MULTISPECIES: hypothetical protein [unclassified Pseudomonas]